MTNPYSSSLAWINSQKDSMIALLEKWVNINSWSENPLGLMQMLAELQCAFAPLGGNMKCIPLPKRTIINSTGEVTELPIGEAIQIIKHPEALIKIFLSGHMDTVYSPDCPFQTAERLHDNLLRGPGAADMKGGLVVLLKSLEALERSPWAGKIGWEVIINPDEEIGSPGSEPLFVEGANQAQIGLIFEPSFTDGALVSSRKGSANYTLVVKGKSAHAGRDFQLGRNAISLLARFIVEADRLTDVEKGNTINIGHIEGGGPVNIVPNLAICRFNVRMIDDKNLAFFEENLHQIVQRLNLTDGLSLTLYENSVRGPKPFDEKHQSLFETVKACGEEIGIHIKWKPSGGVCDGNILSSYGVPTIDTLGVIGGNIHTYEEYMQLDSLVERTMLTSLLLMKIANGEIQLPQKSRS